MKRLHLFGLPLFFLLSLTVVNCNNPGNSTPVQDTKITSSEIDIAQQQTPEKVSTSTITTPIDFLSEVTFSPPVNFKNLQIFMVHGKTNADNLSYVTLKDAMENQWVEIIETSNVNELSLRNNSDKTIFINAGDIIKGGKQDRTLTYDMVIAPRTKEQKLSSFCVEAGRWSKRGNESSAGFSSNTKMLTSRKLKIASKQHNSQDSVWANIAYQQDRINSNVSYYYNSNVDVKSSQSASSLELTLDNKELRQMKEDYKSTFKDLTENTTIGFAYAINGELYNVDIYNNRQLFLDLFDKLLDAAIIEAITDLDKEQKEYSYLSVSDVMDALKMDNQAEENSKELNERTTWLTKEDDEKFIFSSHDKGNDLKWLHRNIIIKEK